MQIRTVVLTMTMTLAWTLAGCAKPPQPAIDAANQALYAARAAQARTYAAASLQAAEDAAALLDAELKAQGNRAAFMRSYSKAAQLAEAAQVAAQEAAADAESGKEKSKQEVGVAIEATRAAVNEAKAAIERLPNTAALHAARQAAEAELAGTEAILGDAERALNAGELATAKLKAQAAGAVVTKARPELDEALKPRVKTAH